MCIEIKSDAMHPKLIREYSIESTCISRESDADARGNQYSHDVKKLLVRQTSYVGIASLVSSTKTLILTRLLERTQERVPSRRAQRKQYESRFDTAK